MGAPLGWRLLRAFLFLHVVTPRGGGGGGLLPAAPGGGLIRGADGAYMKGVLDTIESWRFVTRFCFRPTPSDADTSDTAVLKKFGLFEFEIFYPTGTRPQIALYYESFKGQ